MQGMMMIALAKLPEGPVNTPPERVRALKHRAENLPEEELADLADQLASEPEEARDYLLRAIDEVVADEHPHVTAMIVEGEWYAVSGGVSSGDDPTWQHGSDAYTLVKALELSSLLED